MGEYRGPAREALERAKREMATGDNDRLKYAALELRMTIESITYERALAYKDEFPETEYETWQPKKVMSVLLEIDPDADKDSSLAFGIESTPGVPAERMQCLGTEKVLSMPNIKNHYDALGSYLHVQTIKQHKAGVKPDPSKIRLRCEQIADFCSGILTSPIFNVTLGSFVTIECEECGDLFRKRVPPSVDKIVATCATCGARYDVTKALNSQLDIVQQQTELKCQGPGCDVSVWAGSHQIEIGCTWTCEACHGQNKICLGVTYEPPGTFAS